MKKRVIFFIQGEGRGHLTQSLALKDRFNDAGFELQAVIVGKSPLRQLPDFFTSKIGTEIVEVESPNFIMDKEQKGLDLFITFKVNLQKLGIFKQSRKTILETLDKYKPDFIINFYEPLLGLLNLSNKIKYPTFSIAHQYIFHHSKYEFPKGFISDRFAVKLFTNLTGNKSVKRFALSLYPLQDEGDIIVIPPILRKEVFMYESTNGNYLLIYLLNQGYLEEVKAFHQSHPGSQIHVFTDKKDIIDGEEVMPGLFIHKLNDLKFLEKMAGCKGMLSTAGFESVAEAMHFGKPVLMVPVKGHFEQYCNSRDATEAGAGTFSNDFNIQKLNDFIPNYVSTENSFNEWLKSGEDKLVNEINKYFLGN